MVAAPPLGPTVAVVAIRGGYWPEDGRREAPLGVRVVEVEVAACAAVPSPTGAAAGTMVTAGSKASTASPASSAPSSRRPSSFRVTPNVTTIASVKYSTDEAPVAVETMAGPGQ